MIRLRELEVVVPLWGISENQTDSLPGVNGQRSYRISLSVTAEVHGPLAPIQHVPSDFQHGNILNASAWWQLVLISSTGNGEGEAEPWQTHVEPFPFWFPALQGWISPDPSWRWGAELCLAEEGISPILWTPASGFVHPEDEKTTSSWWR